jgi:hypothetical protein
MKEYLLVQPEEAKFEDYNRYPAAKKKSPAAKKKSPTAKKRRRRT